METDTTQAVARRHGLGNILANYTSRRHWTRSSGRHNQIIASAWYKAKHCRICHGESVTQVGAIVESIEKKLKEEGRIRAHHVEGLQNSQWVLLDYFDILVHVFQEEYRSFYKLEELWADGVVTEVKETV